jgi:hypothetical protein
MINRTTGPIEKGANDGQTSYANDLVKAIRAGVSTRPRTDASAMKAKKGRKRKGDSDAPASGTDPDARALAKPSDWGLFEPVHGILGPVLDIFQPLFNAQSLAGLLLFLLIISWFRNSRHRVGGDSSRMSPWSGIGASRRISAYEEIWRTEESSLWNWLEDRVGMGDSAAYPKFGGVLGNADGSRNARKERANVLGGTQKVLDEVKGMGEREIQWALETTEERLMVLRSIVEKSKRAGAMPTESLAGNENGDDV